jgi:hypothetical protein
MSDQTAARAPQSADGHGGLRLLALAAVALGLLLLAAAAFVLSYAGIHAVALSAGVSPRLARIYPLIFDAMLVVTGAAVLALRSAGLPSRSYAWLSMLALLAAAAAADALHATGTRLPRRPAAATAAVIPWALVLIGFGLLLCMLRQARLRRARTAAARPDVPVEPSGHVSVRPAIVNPSGPGTSSGLRTAGPVRGQPVWAPAETLPDPGSDLAIDAEPAHDDPASDEAGTADQPTPALVPRIREEQPAGHGGRYADRPASAFSPAPTLAPSRDPSIEPDAEVEVEAGPEAQAVGESAHVPETEPTAQAEAEPEAETAPGAAPRDGSDAGPAPTAEPVPMAPQFDRKRSSPVPPEG